MFYGPQATRCATEIDQVTMWLLTDNHYDNMRPDVKNAGRYHLRPLTGKEIV